MIFDIEISPEDRKRLLPHLRGAHSLFPWLRTNPSELDVWMAYQIEKESAQRCLILQKLLRRAQRLQRTREMECNGC